MLIVAGQGGLPAKEPGSAGRVKPALDALRRDARGEARTSPTRTRCSSRSSSTSRSFEWNDEEERWDATHHLFTSVQGRGPARCCDSDPGQVRSNAYDIACNGQEIGSGSIRIHRREEQERIFQLLGISDEDAARERFGHMLEAFEYGAPPHGGIAPGIDRTVALFAQETDIREVDRLPEDEERDAT